MASFKKLSKSDVTFVPYYANKQWSLTYCPYPTSSEYLTIYNGTNLTGSFSSDGDPVTEGQYDRLVYSQINQLFYQKYTTQLNTSSLANSIYYESASQQRPTQSYFIYNDSAKLVENFPTGAMEGIRVLAINQGLYGDKVLPNHFRLSSSAYNITDDGYGNLYDYSSSITHVGNLFYAHGLGIITNQDYQYIFPLPPIAKNDYGSFLTTDSPKTISASLNDYARSGTLNTSSLAFSGSTSGPGYSWATGSNGTIVLTTIIAGTYSVYYTIGADIASSCAVQLRSNKAKVTAVVTEPTTTTTTTTTTTAAPTTTTTSTTTTTTTAPTTTTTTTTSTTTTTTTVAPCNFQITEVITTNPTIPSGSDGTATITFVSASAPVSYSLNGAFQGVVTSSLLISNLSSSVSYTASFIDANSCTATSSFTLGESSFVFLADYMMLTYEFTDGQDLDTRTRIVTPDVGQITQSYYVGYFCQNQWPSGSANPYLIWGGDNQGTGSESVLVNFVSFSAAYPTASSVLLDMRAYWFNQTGSNPVDVAATLWKGGIPIYNSSSYVWTNPTATSSFNIDSVGKVITSQGLPTPGLSSGERVATLTYNLISGSGVFDNNDTTTPSV